MNTAILTLVFAILCIGCQAQKVETESFGPQPEVGKLLPPFSLDHVTHYKTTRASLSSFSGKWLFLDFWFPGCTSCIKSFRKINQLQEQFRDKVQFLLIGLNHQKYGGTENLFERLRKMQNLNLAVAYDSVLHARWDIWAMPYIIIIDPQGIVRYITDGRDMTADKINHLITGKEASFYPINTVKAESETEQLVDSEAANQFDEAIIYSSRLTRWKRGRLVFGDINLFMAWPPEYQEKGFESMGVPLAELYKQAYVGQGSWSLFTSNYSKRIAKVSGTAYWDASPQLYPQFYPTIILEVQDSSLFKYDVNKDSGLYNYQLKAPLAKLSRSYLMRVLQEELRNIFGYDVLIEFRKMPVWKLVVHRAGKNIKTKGGEPFITLGSLAAGFTVRNFPLEEFLGRITVYIGDGRIPFFDETGINYPIDLTMDADMTNFEEVRKALQKNGLDLVKGEKEMKVLVIRDGRPK